MKLVKETISFERGKDPKEVLGIGNITDFDSYESFLDYIIYKLPSILDTTDIPEDIIKDNECYILTKYFRELVDYLTKKNIKLQGISYTHYDWIQTLHNRLKELGYKTK